MPRAHARQTADNFAGHVVAVTAGDTLDVQVGGTRTLTVRLHGVECPTTPRALRETATRYTTRLVMDSDVRVEVRGTVSRWVVYGEVYPAGSEQSLNVALVQVGLARWSSAYAASRIDLQDAEAAARDARSGLWGARDGSNVVLPPLPEPSPTPKPTPAMSAATAIVASPKPSPSPVAPSQPKRAPAIDSGIFFAVVGAMAAFLAALAALNGYARQQRLALDGRRITAQLILATLAAGIGALALGPLASASPSATVNQPVYIILATMLPVIALLALRYGVAKTERAIRLRGAAVDPRHADLGFVKLQGMAQSMDDELVHSGVGDIRGIYVRERTERYTAESEAGKPRRSPRWVPLYDAACAVDFTITTTLGDGTGTARVLTEQNEDLPGGNDAARWLPYHVARFYNDIPTDAWYGTAYEGDTRTEVYFVPDGTTLTVWGNLYPPAFHEPSEKGMFPVPRVASDGTVGSLIITDGAEARAYSGPAAVTQWLGLAALVVGFLCAGGAIYVVWNGGALAHRLALTATAIGTLVLLLLAARRAAVLAQNQRTEAARNYMDPLRCPATAVWEQYQRSLWGRIIAPAFGD